MNVENVDFIKIDVDGPDRLVMVGARETIQRCKPTIYIEYGVEQLKWEKEINNLELLQEHLVPDGYTVHKCKVESNNIILVP
jgi:hypothetical protein